ncbi:glycosyl hydrolase [Spirillospora sp. NPDC046719]
MTSHPRRPLRAALTAAALTAALAAVPGTAAAAPPTPFGAAFAQRFASPPSDSKPKIRYWWPCGDISPAAIDTEVRQIAEHGFGAAEIQCMFTGDPAKNGWGGEVLTDRLEEAVAAGRRYGVHIDLTVGPSWPLVVPGLTPDSPQAAQEIVYGRAVVQGGATYSGPPPAAPAPKPGVTRQTLVAVQALRCPSGCSGAKPVKLDRASLVDLTGSVRNGAVTWKAPPGGEWMLLGYWQRGTGQASVSGQSVSGEPAYVVDHFSAAGAGAATAYWDEHVLTPQLRKLLKANGGDLFEDSLELDSAQHWTAQLPASFQRLRGYSLLESLPALFIDGIHRQYTSVTPAGTPDFEFTDGSGARVRDDYYRTLTDLYIGQHVKPLQTWAHSRGLRYRAQPYGTTIDTPSVEAAVDVPETESLGMDDGYSDEPFRQVSNGAVHLTGHGVFSLECCATYNDAYGQTWPQMLKHFNTAFAYGVNQVVFHGYATADGLGATGWPGFSPFTTQGGNGFSEAWGPRQATWADTSSITGWTSRMQFALRQGRPAVDLALYRQSYGTDTPSLQAPGYTSDFTGPDQLAATTVRDHRLAPDGPGYRALILDDQKTMPLATARLLLEHARNGLPIVVIGAAPGRTPGDYRAKDQDAELTATIKKLLAEPSVRRIDDQSGLAATLRNLGLRPAAEPSATSGLLSARRVTAGGQLYYLYNPTASTISTDISLEGSGTPYTMDAWTGGTKPVGRYRTEAGRVTVPVTLSPGGSTLVALGNGTARHVTATTGGEVVTAGDTSTLRTTTPGTYTVTWDDGKRSQLRVAQAPASPAPAGWKLTVEDWRKGAGGDRETVEHDLDLTDLKPWSQIPDLQDASGVGTYTTTVRLDQATGAYLDLGKVTDTFEVSVNGRPLPPSDQVSHRIDLGGHLRNGTNTITVRVATPLRNRLRVTPGFPAQAAEPRQEYGLIGPVRITPYTDTPITR